MKKTKNKKIEILIAIIAVLFLMIIAVLLMLLDDRHVEITLNGEEHMRLEYGTAYLEPGAEAKCVGRVFGTAKNDPPVQIRGAVDPGRLGSYSLEYVAEAFGRSASVERTVQIVDTVAPVITLRTVEGYSATWMEGYTEEGYSATDNADGDITASVVRTEEPGKITYFVSDSSGNTASVERTYSLAASTPSITLLGERDMVIHASTNFSDPGFVAADGNGNDLTGLVQVSGEVLPYACGSYELTYSITNSRGDTASTKRNVTVIPVEKPEIVTPGAKTIYLTFDDGPGPYTSRLLDILAQYGAKATFFVTGTDRDYSDMIGRAYREGHAIGVHTNSHDYSAIYSSEEAFFNDFFATEELIYRQTGAYTRLFRFPGGSSNTVSRFNPGIMTRLTQYMSDMGYKYFDWNVDSGDAWQTNKTEDVAKSVTKDCAGFRTAIVLQHDIKNYSVEAVEDILIWGLENGYQFLPLDMTSPEAHHGIAN